MREREWEEERARIGGSAAQCWGGQRCRHRKPLLLQATEDGRQAEREREKTERERSPQHFRGQPNEGERAQEHYSGWWEEKLKQRDKKRGERL